MSVCSYFDEGVCRSCSSLLTPYENQLTLKEEKLHALLDKLSPDIRWKQTVQSPPLNFRNKAKMAMIATREGIILASGAKTSDPVSLCHCPLYPELLQNALEVIQLWLNAINLTPYDIVTQKGEGKFVIVTQSFSSNTLMVRFVLRSHHQIDRIEKNLSTLLAHLPTFSVVTVNIQPIPMAVLEGDEEIILTDQDHLSEVLNDIPLTLQPKSFFQTNPFIAKKLYSAAALIVKECKPTVVWDLFCGVGGFALSVAPYAQKVVGIEKEKSAVACATQTAKDLNLSHLSFQALDLLNPHIHVDQKADLIIVNPPRRGLGEPLIRLLLELQPLHILYSSCNGETLASDCKQLYPTYTLTSVQLFDMFPHTDHYEVLVLLTTS